MSITVSHKKMKSQTETQIAQDLFQPQRLIFYVRTTCSQQYTSSFFKHHSSTRHFTIINFSSECDVMAV